MGFFDSIKNALGGKEKAPETVKGPSMVLREADIDPSGLDFSFGSDGSVTVTGHVQDEATREKIGKIIGDIPQVTRVDNQLIVGQPEVAEPEPEPGHQASPTAAEAASPEAAPEAVAPAPSEAADQQMETYTVKPGDSLWKIAEARYGNGNKYHAIFDANRDILDNPDLIKPGQVLKLPEA